MVTPTEILISIMQGAVIGFCTNWLAIKSLFRPLQPRIFWKWKLQGAIPRNKEKLAHNISEAVGNELLDNQYLIEQFQNPALQKSLSHAVADRIDRLLSASPASVFSRMPSDWQREGMDKVTQHLLAQTADWSESESALEVKQWLLDALEARLGALRVDQMVPQRQLEEIIAAVSEVLSKPETRKYLSSTLRSQLRSFLESDTPLEEIVPKELRQLLHSRVRREIPEILDRVAHWLEDPKNVESIVTRIIKSMEKYANQEGFLTEIGLWAFKGKIETFLWNIPDLARKYLHSKTTRRKIAAHLQESVNVLLSRPVSEVVGKRRTTGLAQRIGKHAATWISSPEVQEAIADFLRQQYSHHSKRRFDEVVPKKTRNLLRQRMLKMMRFPRDKVDVWSMQLSSFLRERLQHNTAPLREVTDLSRDDEEAIVHWTQDKAARLLQENALSLIEQLPIKDMVRQKVMKFPLLRVENLIRNIINDQLNYIIWAGAVIGGIVGLIFPFLAYFFGLFLAHFYRLFLARFFGL